MNATEILLKYSNGEITLEAANIALDEIGAGYRLEPKATGGWTEEEMEQGFRHVEPAEALPERPDMSRKQELAGQTIIQRTKRSTYAVTYDEFGYAVKAVKQ